MSLLTDLQEAIRSYASGQTEHRELQRWLNANVQEVEDAGDPTLFTLCDEAWIVLAEVGYGDRDEASARTALAQYAPNHRWTPTTSALPAAVTFARGRGLKLHSTHQFTPDTHLPFVPSTPAGSPPLTAV